MRYGAARSRRLLIDSLKALADFQDALTVVGAHAVHVWVEKAWGPTDMAATRDCDLVVNPVLVTDDPKLVDIMARVGVAPALQDRPGIYGLPDESGLEWRSRTTIDLIVPEAYAGGGRRAARIAGQKNAAGRAVGLELAVWDRHRRDLSCIDEPGDQVSAWVAGPASLLVAKAHKVHERMAQLATRPHRLRAKDSGDVALLMMVSEPEDVARVMMEQSKEHPEIAAVVGPGAQWLVEMYADPSSRTRSDAASALGDRFDETFVHASVEAWVEGFRATEMVTARFPAPRE
jgi:hypothetical protein